MCDRDGCSEPASHAPKLCVPATGRPIDTHQPLAIIFGLQCCRKHVDEMKAETFLSEPQVKMMFEMAARASCAQSGVDYIAPDFDRAFIEKIRIDSMEFLNFMRIRQEAKNGPQNQTGKPA